MDNVIRVRKSQVPYAEGRHDQAHPRDVLHALLEPHPHHGNIPPPRDPNEDDDDEDEDSDTEPDEPAVIREPDEDD